MPLTSRQCRLGNSLERLAGRLPLAVLVAVATSLGLLSPAPATPIAYTLSPTVLAGGDQITGGFTFDPSGPTLDSVDLMVTGPTGPGVYNFPLSATASLVLTITSVFPLHEMVMVFADPLASIPDPVNQVTIDFSSLSPTQGAAVPTLLSPVPEPTSLFLLASALGLMLFRCRMDTGQSPSRWRAKPRPVRPIPPLTQMTRRST
jgi:hypothetical protein